MNTPCCPGCPLPTALKSRTRSGIKFNKVLTRSSWSPVVRPHRCPDCGGRILAWEHAVVYALRTCAEDVGPRFGNDSAAFSTFFAHMRSSP